MPRVPTLCSGETVVCVASGPSVTLDDVNACRGRARVIAVNDVYQIAPWADALYAGDVAWWQHHAAAVDTFAGLKVSIVNKTKPKESHGTDVLVLADTGFDGLETEPTGLRRGLRGGSNSGYQAIGLAVHLGAARIVLLGYDMERPDHGPSHFFGEHPVALRAVSPFGLFRRSFERLVEPLRARGIAIVNCSRRTALTCFPRQTLAEALG